MSTKNKIIAVSAAAILFLTVIIVKTDIMLPSKPAWIEDINYLQKTLTAHDIKFYYSDTSRIKFNEQLNQLKKETKHLDDNKIEIKLSQIVASLGEAHTSFGDLYSSGSAYPITTDWFDEGLFVVQADKEYEQVIGAKLIMINSIKINDIMSKVDTLISHENNQWLKVQEPSYLNDPEVLKYFKITDGKEAVFTFKDFNNKTFNVKISPKNINSINFTSIRSKVKSTPLCLEKKDYYWYKYLPESELLYFQYNACGNKEDLKRLYPGDASIDKLPTLNDLSDEIHELMKIKKVTKFVIDFRYNTGGNDVPGRNFIESFKDIENSNIKFYAIVSKWTFSSAVLNTIDMKDILNAEIVGEDTGGCPNSYGDKRSDKLPNSGIEFSYCTKLFTNTAYKDTVTPDIKVKNSIYDYMNGIDSAMDAITKK